MARDTQLKSDALVAGHQQQAAQFEAQGLSRGAEAAVRGFTSTFALLEQQGLRQQEMEARRQRDYARMMRDKVASDEIQHRMQLAGSQMTLEAQKADLELRRINVQMAKRQLKKSEDGEQLSITDFGKNVMQDLFEHGGMKIGDLTFAIDPATRQISVATGDRAQKINASIARKKSRGDADKLLSMLRALTSDPTIIDSNPELQAVVQNIIGKLSTDFGVDVSSGGGGGGALGAGGGNAGGGAQLSAPDEMKKLNDMDVDEGEVRRALSRIK